MVGVEPRGARGPMSDAGRVTCGHPHSVCEAASNKETAY